MANELMDTEDQDIADLPETPSAGGEDTDPLDFDQPGDEPAEKSAEAPVEEKPVEEPVEEKAAEPDPMVEAAAAAKAAGLSDEQIARFKDADSLSAAAELAASLKPVAPEEKKPDPVDEFPDLDPTEYDEAIVKQFGGLKEHNRKLNSRLMQMAAKLDDMNFEMTVAALDDDAASVLGTKPTRALDAKKDGEVLAAREAVKEKMDQLAAGYEALGKPVPEYGALFNEALYSVHGPKIKTNTKARIGKQIRDTHGQFAQRPSRRDGEDHVAPEQRAAQKIKAKLEDMGVPYEDDTAEDYTL